MAGVEALGYMVFDLAPAQLPPMRLLLGQIMGLDLADDGAGGFYARIDGRAFRLHFRHSDAYRIAAIGWEVADDAALAAIRAAWSKPASPAPLSPPPNARHVRFQRDCASSTQTASTSR